MRILACDPGLNLGWAIVDSKDGLLDFGIFRSKLPDRFVALNEYGDFIQERFYLPDSMLDAEIDALVCEEVLDGSHNLKTSEALFWTVGTYLAAGCVASIMDDVTFHTIHPATVKKHIAGRGGATKEEVIAAVSGKYGFKLKPSESHIADAIALADCYFARAGV